MNLNDFTKQFEYIFNLNSFYIHCHPAFKNGLNHLLINNGKVLVFLAFKYQQNFLNVPQIFLHRMIL